MPRFNRSMAAWSKVGVQLHGHLTREALAEGGIGYQVEKTDFYELTPEGLYVRVPGIFGMRRSDTERCLPAVAVGRDYKPHQTDRLLSLCDALSTTGRVRWDCAGEIFGGRKIWALGEMPGSFEVRAGDLIAPFILAYTSFDGSSHTEIAGIAMRFHCSNAIRMALKKADARCRLRHTSDDPERMLEKAKADLALVHCAFEAEAAEAKRLAETRMDLEQFLTFATELLTGTPEPNLDAMSKAARTRLANKLETLGHNFTSGLGNLGQTRWDGLNSVTQWIDHQENRAKAAKTRELTVRGFESSTFGYGVTVKARAKALLTRW